MVETNPMLKRDMTRRRFIAPLAGLALTATVSGRANAATTPGLTVVGRDQWLFPLWDVMSHLDRAQLQTVTGLLNEAIGLLRQAHIEVMIAVVPSKARSYRQYLPSQVRLAPDIDKRYPLVLAELSRSGALVPDLDTPFLAAARSQQLYFKADTHWLPEGAALVANELARKAASRLRLPASPWPGAKLGEPVTLTNPVSDLLRFLPPADRAAYSPEQYRARQVVVAAGPAALIDDDSADVMVVGNSFSQPRYGFQAQLSQAMNRPIALVWKPNNYGAYHTLLAYLRSPVFRQQRPKLLVWQHLEIDMQNLPNSSSWGQNAMPPRDFIAGVQAALRG